MPRDPRKYLHDILECCRFLEEHVSGHTLDDYAGDRGFRSAVERELQISEHRRIISFRHVLVHGYDSLDHGLVWTLVQDKLPVLRAQVESLLLGDSGQP